MHLCHGRQWHGATSFEFFNLLTMAVIKEHVIVMRGTFRGCLVFFPPIAPLISKALCWLQLGAMLGWAHLMSLYNWLICFPFSVSCQNKVHLTTAMAYNILALLAIGLAVGIKHHCSGPAFQDLMNRQVRQEKVSFVALASILYSAHILAYSGVGDRNMLVLLTLRHLILLTHFGLQPKFVCRFLIYFEKENENARILSERPK